MVRTVKMNHHEEDEVDDDDFSSDVHDVSSKVKLEGKSGDQKVNTLRSKHSETEQRRRSKINERFQILRDLIPETDQKRDKASFLLEVIQYIQFLQEKIQMVEGTYQGWSPEPSKLMSWRNNSGSVENFVDQPHILGNGSGHEDNIGGTSALLTNSQNSIGSDLSGAALYRPTDLSLVAGNQETPLNIPMQPNLFEVVSTHPVGSYSDHDLVTSQCRSQLWSAKPCISRFITPTYDPNLQEQQDTDSGEAEARGSDDYPQGLLNTLTEALQSSGVDLSRASISVQLDVHKRLNGGATTTPTTKDHPLNIQQMAGYGSTVQSYDHSCKKQKTDRR